MDPDNVPADELDAAITDTERALLGQVTAREIRSVLDTWVRRRLSSAIGNVRFRAGRIDVVWGVELEDGRSVVIKVHRSPADVPAILVAQSAQRRLATAGFPCAVPLAGPDEIDGKVVTAETLIAGRTPNGRDPTSRRLLAAGLARHIDILHGHADLVHRTGLGPSWCRYRSGPWPVPHDPAIDFRSTPEGFAWLDAFGGRAASQILAHRNAGEIVVGHADWYAGNTVVADGVLVGTFDWDLVADAEAVIAGFAAACFSASSTGAGGLSTPGEVAAFMHDYEAARARSLTPEERRTAAGAAAWIIAFNARWQLALMAHGTCDEATVSLVRDRGKDYLSVAW